MVGTPVELDRSRGRVVGFVLDAVRIKLHFSATLEILPLRHFAHETNAGVRAG